MNTINDVVQNETPQDVVLFLTKSESRIDVPRLDRLYSQNNWINLSNSYELLILIKKMKEAGMILDDRGLLSKGPNWEEPVFSKEKNIFFENHNFKEQSKHL